ncbi:shikimate kinase [Flavobacterium sp.]|uniref:shikimate kinase n=1 Tax=Flavobacterium sp. TaxID=239 RepID=UPI0039E2C997
MKKIILLGYMGAGKSVVAQLLSQKTALPWVDLDQMIEEKEQATISDIFEKQGEIKFRKLEHALFQQLMQNDQSFVLSLGGGTPCYANNHELLKGENVVSVYLKTSIDQLYHRLLPQKQQRPLIAHMADETMKEFIAISLFERSYYYLQATHTVTTDGKTPAQVVSEIEKILV